MTVADWLNKAKVLKAACNAEVRNKNGNGVMSGKQYKDLQSLQNEIDSNHGIKEKAKYSEVGDSLNKMFDMVRTGKKTPPLTAT